MTTYRKAVNDAGIIALMDYVLLAITDGKDIPMDRLRSLPPWRAVMLARVAVACGAMDADTLNRLVGEAKDVGGAGTLSLSDNRPED